MVGMLGGLRLKLPDMEKCGRLMCGNCMFGSEMWMPPKNLSMPDTTLDAVLWMALSTPFAVSAAADILLPIAEAAPWKNPPMADATDDPTDWAPWSAPCTTDAADCMAPPMTAQALWKKPPMADEMPERMPCTPCHAETATDAATWKNPPMAERMAPRAVKDAATPSMATASTLANVCAIGDTMLHTTCSTAPTTCSTPARSWKAPLTTGRMLIPRFPSASTRGCMTGDSCSMADCIIGPSTSITGCAAWPSHVIASESPCMPAVAADHTAEPSGASAAWTLFWMSCHCSGQSMVACSVPSMSPCAPSAAWPSSSRLIAPLLSAATNCGALRAPKMSFAALMAAASSPASIYPWMASTESRNACLTSPPCSATDERAFFMLPMTPDALRPALSSMPAMSAVSSKENPSSCIAGPAVCTTDTSESKPIPVVCTTPKR